MVANPPYGTRLGEAVALRGLYRTLGSRLNEEFSGWRLGLLTGDPELSWATGLRARRTYSLYNGALPVKLYTFVLGEDRRRGMTGAAAGRRAPGGLSTERARPPLAAPSAADRGPRPEDRAGMFADRLRKNMRHLAKWARREGVTCYRLYDADLPEYNLAVDLYERWVHVQEYEAPATVDEGKARERLNAALAVIPDVLGVSPDDVFLKVRRRQRGAAQYGRQGSTGRFHEVGEGGCRFLVNFTDYLDTGLFLDQRPTRDLIAELARGRRFLNLFGYTGTATVRAAQGRSLRHDHGRPVAHVSGLGPTQPRVEPHRGVRQSRDLERTTGTRSASPHPGRRRSLARVGSRRLRCGVPRSAHVLELPARRRTLVRRAAGPRAADQGRRS